jgi:photosystem II stability/assembly factor-like uncharacterized protein
MSSGGPGSGLFKTTDGGDTWTELTRAKGMPEGVIGRIGIAVSGADATRLYAMVEHEPKGGLYRSSDGGESWEQVNDQRTLRQRAFYYTHVYADPKARDTVYVLNTGFYKSTDGGKTFPTTIRAPHGDHHDLWIDPADPQHMVNANDGGGNVSVNGGRTWTDQDYATAQFYHVSTTADVPYHVCGAQQDNTTACLPSQPARTRGGNSLYPAGGGESGYIAPHPKDPDVFYAGSQGALVTRYNRETGQIRDIQPYPRFFSGEPSSALKERWQWTFPIVFSPHDANVLYISSQHIWRTTDEGQTWQKISPDLTRADPKTLGHSGGPITGDMNGPEVFATIFAIAPSPVERGTIWAGSDDGLIHVTRDDGKSWANVTPKDLPEFARVSIVDASRHRGGTAYFAAKRYLLDDRAPYIYRTDDYGKSWTRIVAGIRPDDYVHVVREDPAKAGLLYAGTEHGVYVSFDDGDRWQSLSLNLPDTQVSDLVVERHDLVIGTHGRSFYVLDDIDAIRQITPAITSAPLHVFEPRDFVRGVDDLTFDYYLKEEAETVRVEFLDASGVFRTFTGSPAEDKAAQEAPAGGGGGGFQGPPPRVLRKSGVNRFVWDGRYPGHTTFPGMILWSAPNTGPLAPPGTYQVRVTANGESRTASFDLRRDPRLDRVTDADLKEQFDLAMRIRDRTSEANQAVIRIRDVKAQIEDRLKKAGPEIASAAEALRKRLTIVEEEIYQVRNRSGQDPLNFPIRLNNRLAALRRSVQTGDAKPTDGAYQVFKELSGELDAQLSAFDAATGADLTALNRMLARSRLAPIVVGSGGMR